MAEDKKSEDHKSWKTKARNYDIFYVILFLVLIIVSIVVAIIPSGIGELRVVARLLPVDSNTWALRGRVLNDGVFVKDALVWVVAKGHGDNEDSPASDKTNSLGEFKIDSIPRTFSLDNDLSARRNDEDTRNDIDTVLGAGRSKISDKVREVEINARLEIIKSSGEREKIEVLEGKKVITVRETGSLRRATLSGRKLLFIPIIFLISIVIPFLLQSYKLKYICSMIIAFLFTVAIIFAISVGISQVSTIADVGESLSLGFAHIFQGPQNEWVFSLTSTPGKGFYVPLWVLLLSVIGSSLFTFLIIISEIKQRPDFTRLQLGAEDKNELKKFQVKIEDIVRHQFYMLFSPLGAIFVYQILVVAETTTQPVTVAIAALGAGSTLNILLDVAVDKSKEIIQKYRAKFEKSVEA